MPLLRPIALFLALLPLACATCSVSSFARDKTAYEPVAEYDARSVFAKIGAPVGRLVIKTKTGNYTCTAFLISKNHALTNEHCLATTTRPSEGGDPSTKSEVPVQSVHLQMGFLDQTQPDESVSYEVKLPALEMDKRLDYAIVEIVGDAAGRFGYLSLSTDEPIANDFNDGIIQPLVHLQCGKLDLVANAF
ncbi:MAG: trypsin-like serine protease, partial [Pseudomonadota bacterium]